MEDTLAGINSLPYMHGYSASYVMYMWVYFKIKQNLRATDGVKDVCEKEKIKWEKI